ncbi:unnamed protein product [Clonostachys solani]|uniref:Uncharacterized protein n=1 Tax=Clonostachys solani TaxID=160281 RepID=A0A9P0EK69_9HYPO|nr:unnamed protein product [Clonostachys solani]
MASDEIPEPSSVNMGKRPAPDEHAPAENQGLDAPKASDERPKKKAATKTKGERLFDEITKTPEAFWYEHRGCIDVDVISDYIAAHKTYEKKLQKCTQDESAQPPKEPTLSDYTTGDTVSHCLWDILNHDDSEEMKAAVPKFSLYD